MSPQHETQQEDEAPIPLHVGMIDGDCNIIKPSLLEQLDFYMYKSYQNRYKPAPEGFQRGYYVTGLREYTFQDWKTRASENHATRLISAARLREQHDIPHRYPVAKTWLVCLICVLCTVVCKVILLLLFFAIAMLYRD